MRLLAKAPLRLPLLGKRSRKGWLLRNALHQRRRSTQRKSPARLLKRNEYKRATSRRVFPGPFQTARRGWYDPFQKLRAGTKRRDFVKAIGSSAVLWPITAYAQQASAPLTQGMANFALKFSATCAPFLP